MPDHDPCCPCCKQAVHLAECMHVASLQAFMRGRPPMEVAEHLRSVVASWGGIEKLVERLRPVVAAACKHLESMGYCEECEDDTGYCQDEACTYCAISRATEGLRHGDELLKVADPPEGG
ncbi:hypothetical protein LCGC14_0953090 [marine sediment metagenome]|uniref:Uncharacterized protein n=1 Tax=marine sediment metagenome TaxID=412755 RepID=A0A0F9RN20_9ZZZZ